jgi:hypothetical protein
VLIRILQFSPRHPNATKAMANWERKSAYLLREIVKFKTYVDSLKVAQQQKEAVEQEREVRAAEKAAREAGVEVKTTMLEVGGASEDVPPLPSPTTGLLLDAMPMPPGTSQSA